MLDAFRFELFFVFLLFLLQHFLRLVFGLLFLFFQNRFVLELFGV